MKTHHLTGFGISTVIHILLGLLLVPILFAKEKQVDEPPVLPVELSMFEPQAPEPAPESVSQVVPEPPLPPPPKPESKPKPKEKPKEKPKSKPEKRVEKPLPKPKPEKNLRKEREERERHEQLQRQREEQQRLEELQRRQAQQRERERAEAEQQARWRAQQQAARAAAQAQQETPLITNPRYRSPPKAPQYPRRALESGIEGRVIVRASVGASGRVQSVQVHQSSGNNSLDAAALKAVRGWSFVPASRGGRNIESIVQVPVTFKIK